MFHYTEKDGWKAIRSQVTWCFKAVQPPASERPGGAYFTDLDPQTNNLATRLRIPRQKLEYVFQFRSDTGLIQWNGGMGRDRHIFYSPRDYEVPQERQQYEGSVSAFLESNL